MSLHMWCLWEPGGVGEGIQASLVGGAEGRRLIPQDEGRGGRGQGIYSQKQPPRACHPLYAGEMVSGYSCSLMAPHVAHVAPEPAATSSNWRQGEERDADRWTCLLHLSVCFGLWLESFASRPDSKWGRMRHFTTRYKTQHVAPGQVSPKHGRCWGRKWHPSQGWIKKVFP